eukprot:776074-Amorphochlora_amoeboformis.AAC.1
MDPKSQQHAQHLWGFLDDLAEKDPAGYKKFMEEKMREAKKVNLDCTPASKAKNAPPRPKYVVSSKLQGQSLGLRLQGGVELGGDIGFDQNYCRLHEKSEGKWVG